MRRASHLDLTGAASEACLKQAMQNPFKTIAILTAALLGVSFPAHAEQVRQNPVAILELFTSQGCSSCPPADRLLEQMSQRSDIVALAYHVDYWDYAGWADTLGSKANSDRQRAYAKAWGSGRIYTPQVVVNGAIGVVGSQREAIDAAMGQSRLPVPLTVSANQSLLAVDAAPLPGQTQAMVWLVTYRSSVPVSIGGGENTGRTVQYAHVVTGRQILGVWDPEAGAHFKLPLAEVLGEQSDGAAVLIQTDNGGLPGPILGAAAFER